MLAVMNGSQEMWTRGLCQTNQEGKSMIAEVSQELPEAQISSQTDSEVTRTQVSGLLDELEDKLKWELRAVSLLSSNLGTVACLSALTLPLLSVV